MEADPVSEPPPYSRRQLTLYLGLLYGLHLLVAFYVFPPAVVGAPTPYGGGDYQTHFHQTLRLSEALESTGRMWAYEPRFLAGHPMGLFFDVDNKAHFLWSYGLHRLGLPLSTAFNLFALLSALLVPWVLVLAARLFGLRDRALVVTMGLSTAVYFLDTATRFFTSAGMISYVMSAHLSILVLALYMRLLYSPDRGSWRFFLPTLVLLPLVHLIHVWAFAILVGPLVFLYLWNFRGLGKRCHAQVGALVLAVLALNAYWLVPAFVHRELLTQSHKLGQAKPFFFFMDLFETLPFSPPEIVQTTCFRFIALGGAVSAVYRWFRDKDPRRLAAITIMGWLFFLTYVSAVFPLFGLTEPYRFVTAFGFIALVLCGATYGPLLSFDAWRRGLRSPEIRTIVVLAAVLLPPQLARQLFASAPETIPTPQALTPDLDPAPWDRHSSPIEPPQTILQHRNIPKNYELARKRLTQRCGGGESRILVEPWELGEYLGWASELHVIGGFPDRRMIYENANLFRDIPTHPRYWGQRFRNYLGQYNIGCLLIHLPIFPMIEGRRALPKLLERIGPYRLYAVPNPPGWFFRGTGKVKASLNRIALSELNPAPGTESVSIRFHYIKTLRCRPNCRIEKVSLPDSAASFIRVVGVPRLAREVVLEHRP